MIAFCIADLQLKLAQQYITSYGDRLRAPWESIQMASLDFKVLDNEPDGENNMITTENAKFTVFGVGGGGGNAVDHMVRTGINGIKFVCANTDHQALSKMSAPFRILLGAKSMRGLGAGANPEVGRNAALEDEAAIREAIKGSDMVFVTAGMGGGTGTGAAPVVASLAKKEGVLVVGVVTIPFNYEGRKRMRMATQGIEELKQHVDSLIIIPNEKLLSVYGDISMSEAYKKADDVLCTSVRSIFDLIMNPGHINLDFADLRTAMSNRGYAMMGIGEARGETRARDAAQAAIRSKLLDNIKLKDAKGVLINITGGSNITVKEIQEVMHVASEIADLDEGDIFHGTVFDADMSDEIRVTVIATGLERSESIESSGTNPAAINPALAPYSPASPVGDTQQIPAIDRVGLGQRSAPVGNSSLQTPRPTTPNSLGSTGKGSIKDFLSRQQKRED